MKTPQKLIIGSRDSALALAQTYHVIQVIQNRYPDCDLTLKTFKTKGDIILETALSKIGDKGLFVKELEVAMLAGEIDIAVHSLKDLPTEQPDGLRVIPFGMREDPSDALVGRFKITGIHDLPEGACIGSSSLRRQAMLKRLRPDLDVKDIRGNVPTRLKKLDEGQYDAILLATAGLKRLGLSHRIHHQFNPQQFIPACSQGVLGLEFANPELHAVLSPFISSNVHTTTLAERAFLRTIQGGCHASVGVYAWQAGEYRFILGAIVLSLDGQEAYAAQQEFYADEAEWTGQHVAQLLLQQGAKTLLEKIALASPQKIE